VPELPEVEALVRFLDEQTSGLEIVRCQLTQFAALKTFDPPLDSIVGRHVAGWSRRGKYLCCDTGDVWLVLHLARAGWVRWRGPTLLSAKGTAPGRSGIAAGREGSAPRRSRGPLALSLGFEEGAELDVTEMGSQKRLAIWVVHDPSEVEGIATLGIDPLDPAFTTERLAQILADEHGTVKTVLARQSAIAGIGNAYSDEALHAARLSPFKPAARLTADEIERLHGAVVDVVREAADRASGLPASDLKGDKKRALRVHGRTGEKCPECGDTVREVSFATRSMQYCPTCQTGGKPLADRRLSRLLK
jgi:formamidopyrimidine-DNA glycosylase